MGASENLDLLDGTEMTDATGDCGRYDRLPAHQYTELPLDLECRMYKCSRFGRSQHAEEAKRSKCA